MAAKKSSTGMGPKAPSQGSVITWRKLPKGMELTATGKKSAQLQKIMDKAGLAPRDPCFGGDTCIV